MTEDRHLVLNLLPTVSGYHDAAWRLAGSDPLRGTSVAYYSELAEAAEAACFDSIFLAHTHSPFGLERTNSLQRWDPMVVLGSMAARTHHIGLIGTMSTSFAQPYHVAQAFATLDQISGGRAAWNVVTSASDVDARLFGMNELPDTVTRYRRAAEFVEACQRLWTSWADDALVIDKERGVFADMSKVPEISCEGERFSVRGRFHLPPTPQRSPVIVQAGDSESGKTFAARYAEVVFTRMQDIETSRASYADMKARAAAFGRSHDAIAIVPGLMTLVAATEEEAFAREAELAQHVLPETGLEVIKQWAGIDLSGHPLDEPPPPLVDPDHVRSTTFTDSLRAYIRERNPTLRQLAASVSAGRGHRVFVGTGEQLADLMQECFESGAADGFNIAPLVLPSGLHDFAREVVPILQERGLVRTSYDGGTLRERLGTTSTATFTAA